MDVTYCIEMTLPCCDGARVMLSDSSSSVTDAGGVGERLRVRSTSISGEERGGLTMALLLGECALSVMASCTLLNEDTEREVNMPPSPRSRRGLEGVRASSMPPLLP